MKAAVYDAPGQALRLAEVPDPRPGPGQAVIRVAACGVCGSDLHATTPQGDLARRGGVLGHEVTGEIVEIGPEPAGRWSVGDRVFVIPIGSCGRCPHCRLDRPEDCPRQKTFGALGPTEPDGAYAEYLTVSLTDLLAVPESVPMDVAALCEPLATGLLCVRQAGWPSGTGFCSWVEARSVWPAPSGPASSEPDGWWCPRGSTIAGR